MKCVSSERDDSGRQATAVAVRLALLAERQDLPDDARNELLLLSIAVGGGVSLLGDGRVAFTTGALAAALGLCSRDHLHKWRVAGVGPRALAIAHGAKTTWMYPASGVREWLAEVAIDPRSKPSSKMLDQLAALGMLEIVEPVREAA